MYIFYNNLMELIKTCLNQFCSCSGHKLNLSKSQLYVSNNVGTSFAGYLADKAGIPVTRDLGRYLGVPSIHDRVTEATFTQVMERVKSRLNGCRAKYLSLAVRQVLAQSVLSTIPYSVMQTAKLSLGLCDNIDKRVRNFIWGRPNRERSCSLVKWDKVTQPKERGGLGIRCTRDMNMAFMAKLENAAGYELPMDGSAC